MNFVIAFIAGLFTFFTPCVFPLIPAYISYITGSSFEELSKSDKGIVIRKSVLSAVFFVLGFSFIFVMLGFSAFFVGDALFIFQKYLRIAGGLLVIIFGISLTGWINIKFLDIEKRLSMKRKPAGYLGAFVFGMTFAAGWVPCVGPVLSSILILASNTDSMAQGGMLLFSYCLGLGTPIVISAAAFNLLISFHKRSVKYLKVIQLISGILLIILGFMLLTDNLNALTALMYQIFGYKGI